MEYTVCKTRIRRTVANWRM